MEKWCGLGLITYFERYINFIVKINRSISLFIISRTTKCTNEIPYLPYGLFVLIEIEKEGG